MFFCDWRNMKFVGMILFLGYKHIIESLISYNI
jgi:hypothetical protein